MFNSSTVKIFVSHLFALTIITSLGLPVAFGEEPIQFNRDIRPILSDKCFACHGFDPKNRQAELRLDTLEGAIAAHDGKHAVVPSKPTESELWRRIISTDKSELMPPPESHKTLNDKERELLKKWIEQGATYQKHWSFEAPIKAPMPPSKAAATNPIDAFVRARLQKGKLAMSPEADSSTLIRRVAFATTGLPPTVAELEQYMADQSSDAYERMFDRYLASPRYGEEMARHWLDAARYADTHGLHLDNERQMWAYRDWVINAFNKNQPFDQFTIEQLAGDQLPNPTIEQMTATGFNRCNVTTGEGGSIVAENVYRYAIDRTSTTMQTWLGLTGGCAQCHDHKFDPISQREFFSMYAFFNSAADPGMDGNVALTAPSIKLETADYKAKMTDFDARIAKKQSELDAQIASINYIDPASITPAPEPVVQEIVWLDDDYPAGGKFAGSPGHPTTFVSAADGKVHSGKKALKRKHHDLSQDVWDGASIPLDVPPEATFFAYIWIDPQDVPKSIMLQYHKAGWQHRAVWGDYEIIPWGAKNTPERVHMGPLPATGEWVRLEVSSEKLGLAAGDKLTGFATTQHGGTVYWDKVGVAGKVDPANDPRHSFQAWWKQAKGKDTPGIAPDLNQVAKNGPDKFPKPADVERLQAFYLQTACVDTKANFGKSSEELAALVKERKMLVDSIPGTTVFKDLDKPRDSFVMLRGAYDKPGEKVEPGTLAILPPLAKAKPDGRATRLDLARWIVAPENPLTARVAVNRFWQQLFGTGLTKTSNDLGSQGEVPSHPELLDWLSVEFREQGWDVKKLMRLMLLSQTFRQSSAVTPALLNVDPHNRLYARGPRFRLDAEQLRDNALFVSGLMNQEQGGKGVRPYQPENIWEPVGFVGSNTRSYKQDQGAALYRRSIYVFFKRTAPPPFMANFDAPNREQSCVARDRTNTPLQALQTMNDVQHIEAARVLAERILKDGGANAGERIDFAYRTLLARPATAQELETVEQFLNASRERYTKDPEAAKKLIAQGQSKPNAELAPPELAAYTLLANLLLNLDETLNRN
jgi:hypothetical protein